MHTDGCDDLVCPIQIPVDPELPAAAAGGAGAGGVQGPVPGVHGGVPGHREGPHGDRQALRCAGSQQVVGEGTLPTVLSV